MTCVTTIRVALLTELILDTVPGLALAGGDPLDAYEETLALEQAEHGHPRFILFRRLIPSGAYRNAGPACSLN